MIALTLMSLLLTADPPEPRHVLFFQPVPTLLAAPSRGVVVSGGAGYHMDDAWGLTIDLSVGTVPLWSMGTLADTAGTTFLAVSAGPTRRLLGAGFTGLFITPRASLRGGLNYWERGESPLLGAARERTWVSVTACVGADLSAQWTHGRFFLAAVLGAGLGWHFAGAGPLEPSFTVDALPLLLREPGGPALAVNAQARVGFIF